MASSQVEMTASAPFGCVLRDHNRRDRCRESNARATQAAFQKNLKSLVRDHLHTCISVSNDNNTTTNSQDHIENVDSWARNKDVNSNNHINNNGDKGNSPRQSRVLDRWAARQQGKETMSTMEGQSQEAELLSLPNSAPSSSRTSTSLKEETLSRSDSLAEISNLGVGASSLVQIWEKRLNQSNSFKMSPTGNGMETSRSSSGVSCNENENIFNASNDSNAFNEANASNDSNVPNLEEQPLRGSEAGDSVFVDERYDAGPVTEDSFEDSHSDESATSDHCRLNLDEKERERERERERVRVVDIIKRLASQCPSSSLTDDNDHDHDHDHQSSVNSSPSREYRDRERSFGFDRTELHKGFCQVISSPKMLRGRQAFADLLMHMERDRHRELDTLVDRRAVSRFSQKGRIQSMLRLKLLQRGMSVTAQDVPRRKPAAPQVNKLPQGSAIMHLREKFSNGVEHGSTVQSDGASPRSPHRELAKNSCVRVETSSTFNRPSESIPNHEVNIIEQQNITRIQSPFPQASEDDLDGKASPDSKVTWHETSSVPRNTLPHASEDLQEDCSPRSEVTLLHASKDLHEEARLSSEVICQGTDSVARNALPNASEDLHEEVNPSSEVTRQEKSSVATNTLPHDREILLEEASPSSEVTWQGTSPVARNLELHETADTTTSLVCWDENEIEEQLDDDYQYYGDTSYDWINEISRPRSYWEDIRKAWYQEMLNSNSGKGEIRQLLERKTVSNCLASDFRDRIDRLMVSRLETQTRLDGSQEAEDDEISQDRMNQLMSFLQQRQQQQHIHPAGSQVEKPVQEQEHQEEEEVTTDKEEEEEEEEDDDNDEESRSLISAQFQEAADYFDQCTSLQPSPSHLTTWSYQDNEVGDGSERAASMSPPRHSTSQSYYPNSRQCSPSPFRHSPSHCHYPNSRECSPSPSYHQNHRHYSSSPKHPSIEMEFMYDMRGHMEQLYHEMSELRKAIKSCVDMQMVLQQSIKQEVHSGQAQKKRSSNRLPKKGNCCICHEVKVDSLLYRCGHMCTCLKCAHELQWNSGKCPICRAPIVDVVRAHMDY